MYIYINLGTLISWNPLGHSRPVTGLFHLYIYVYIYKSGNLNFLEPSGPLQACNGTVLPLYIYVYIYKSGNFNFLEPSGPLQACNGSPLPLFTYIYNSGNLNFLEPSGPLRACNGTVLHLYIYIYIILGTLTSWNPLGHSGPVTGLLYHYL